MMIVLIVTADGDGYPKIRDFKGMREEYVVYQEYDFVFTKKKYFEWQSKLIDDEKKEYKILVEG